MIRIPRAPPIARTILARNPCYEPGEIMDVKNAGLFEVVERAQSESRRAAAFEWYNAQQCVCIISTQGERSMADMMQGGDFGEIILKPIASQSC